MLRTGQHMHSYLTVNIPSPFTVEDSGESQSESENSVSDSVDDNDDSVAEISRSFRSRQELCEQLNVNHMIQRIFLITLDNSKYKLVDNQTAVCQISDFFFQFLWVVGGTNPGPHLFREDVCSLKLLLNLLWNPDFDITTMVLLCLSS